MSFKGKHEGEKWQEESKNQKIRTVTLHRVQDAASVHS